MNSKRILVVDDDENFAKLLVDFTQELGYDSQEVRHSKEVLSAIENFHPDLLTLDLEMPEIPGTELLLTLGQNQQTQILPIIVISVAGDQFLEQLKHPNLKAVIGKPVNFHKLSELLLKILGTKP